MRTLSSPLITELGLTITRPGYLVSIGFNTIQRYSSFGTISWNGNTWNGSDIKVDPIMKDTGAVRSSSMTIANTDSAIGAIILGEGVADKAVSIYTIYAGALGAGDTILEFLGVADAAEVNATRATITFTGASTEASFCPRRRISRATGFNTIIPAGTTLMIGGTTYVLERG